MENFHGFFEMNFCWFKLIFGNINVSYTSKLFSNLKTILSVYFLLFFLTYIKNIPKYLKIITKIHQIVCTSTVLSHKIVAILSFFYQHFHNYLRIPDILLLKLKIISKFALSSHIFQIILGSIWWDQAKLHFHYNF